MKPENNISRAETASIFFRLLTQQSRTELWAKTNSYSDVNTGDWSNNGISTLSNGNILCGYPDNTFGPNDSITRAEFASIAARFAQTESGTSSSGATFSDIQGHWAEAEIERAAALGYITGYTDGTFKPNQPITRAEVATLLNKVLERNVNDESSLLPNMVTWPDNTTDAWYYFEVQEATNSHYYDKKPDSQFEYWTDLRPVPNWGILNGPDANPGDLLIEET